MTDNIGNSDQAYNKIDRFLRDNLDDFDYADFSEILDRATQPEPTEVRMLTREETHAVLAQIGPLSAGEFKGMDCVQMTWHRFNECMTGVQRAAFKASGLTVKEPT